MEVEESMARRRYVSTEISNDGDLNELAQRVGDFAALFYTWGIPHAEEDATIRGTPLEILGRVMPLRRDKTPEDMAQVMTALADAGLILWNVPERRMQYPIHSFYRYQTNVAEEKRRTVDITNDYGSKDQQEMLNTRVPLASSPTTTRSTTVRKRKDYTPKFEEFWKEYPRNVNKKGAFQAWSARMNDGEKEDDLILAAKNYKAKCKRVGTEEQYILHAATFLGPQERWKEFVVGESVAVVAEVSSSPPGGMTSMGLTFLQQFERNGPKGGQH